MDVSSGGERERHERGHVQLKERAREDKLRKEKKEDRESGEKEKRREGGATCSTPPAPTRSEERERGYRKKGPYHPNKIG